MRLRKLHALLLLPPALLLTTWISPTLFSSTSLSEPTPSAGRPSFSLLPFVQEVDSDLAQLYHQVRLPKPIRSYQPDLSDFQKRRFASLRAPLSTARRATSTAEEMDGRPLPSADLSAREAGDQDQLYYFTSNLLNAATVLPDIITSLLVLATFLGPKHIFLSIVEGPSKDSTSVILNQILRPRLLGLGVPEDQISIRSMQSSDVDWERGGGSGRGRIEVLAELRNVALEPLVEQAGRLAWGPIIFFNDVLFSAAHVLELLHRHAENNAVQTCAWDVLYNPPTLWDLFRPSLQFYDSWVARTLNGNTFFPVGPSKKHWKPELLFDAASSPEGVEKRAYESSTPFPVFSCFNGITVLSPAPFLPSPPLAPNSPSSPNTPTPRRSPPLKFRTSSPTSPELNHSEAFLLSRDLWRRAVASRTDGGVARVQVVPGVKVAYEHRGTAMIQVEEEEKDIERRMAKGEKGEGGERGNKGVEGGKGEMRSGKQIGKGDGETKIDWAKVKGPKEVLGFGWPEEGGVKGNPWLHGRWVDALWG